MEAGDHFNYKIRPKSTFLVLVTAKEFMRPEANTKLLTHRMNRKRKRIHVENEVFGYRFGLRQYSAKISIVMPDTSGFRYTEAKYLLSKSFMIDTEETYSIHQLGSDEISESDREFTLICSILARKLLQEASVPIYEDNLILELKEQTRRGRGRLISMLTPTVSSLPIDVITSAYQTSYDIVSEFLKHRYHAKPPSQRRQLSSELDAVARRFYKSALRSGRGGFSIRSILKEAFERDIPFSSVGRDVYQLDIGQCAFIISKSSTIKDSAIGARLANNKISSSQFLQEFGFPVASTYLIPTFNAAKRAAQDIGYPVVVKPADRDRGEGVTVDIETDDQLDHAYKSASRWSRNVILQPRVPGICHRLVVFRDELVFAYSRHPYSVIGDGKKNIRSLHQSAIAKEEVKASFLRKKTVPLDDLAMLSLSRQGFDQDTVLAKGGLAYLRPYQSREWGGHDEALLEEVHPENVELARRIGRAFHLEMVGIDLISSDVRKPWYETDAVVGEVNFRPQVANNTAKAMLEMVFPRDRRNIELEYFVGGKNAFQAAQARQLDLISQGVNAFLSSDQKSFGPSGKEIFLDNFGSLFFRSQVLAREDRLQTLILVVQTDELLHRGRPIYNMGRVNIVDERVVFAENPEEEIGRVEFEALVEIYHEKVGALK